MEENVPLAEPCVFMLTNLQSGLPNLVLDLRSIKGIIQEIILPLRESVKLNQVIKQYNSSNHTEVPGEQGRGGGELTAGTRAGFNKLWLRPWGHNSTQNIPMN